MPQVGKNNSRYVAFLRGINVGGHAAIKMTDLKAAFEKMGFDDVRTVLASGNVIFAARQADEKALRAEIESGLKKAFRRDISVLLRNRDDLRQLRSSEPFKGIEALPGVQLYVTFLADGAKRPELKIPYATSRQELRILRATLTEVFSVVDLEKGLGTPEAMAILEKEFGSNLTTRNWNTILKVLM
ncbi:MAG: DUF1697 domain-containing protein [Candidatus Aminicenantes bacterium]|nr:DUF1697 domain-containing protein [Candidatus Aminicenantes bacterium]